MKSNKENIFWKSIKIVPLKRGIARPLFNYPNIKENNSKPILNINPPKSYFVPSSKKPISAINLNTKVSKKQMNWFQAKTKFPKLKPFGDADKDGVMNMYDCKPFDKYQQEPKVFVSKKKGLTKREQGLINKLKNKDSPVKITDTKSKPVAIAPIAGTFPMRRNSQGFMTRQKESKPKDFVIKDNKPIPKKYQMSSEEKKKILEDSRITKDYDTSPEHAEVIKEIIEYEKKKEKPVMPLEKSDIPEKKVERKPPRFFTMDMVAKEADERRERERKARANSETISALNELEGQQTQQIIPTEQKKANPIKEPIDKNAMDNIKNGFAPLGYKMLGEQKSQIQLLTKEIQGLKKQPKPIIEKQRKTIYTPTQAKRAIENTKLKERLEAKEREDKLKYRMLRREMRRIDELARKRGEGKERLEFPSTGLKRLARIRRDIEAQIRKENIPLEPKKIQEVIYEAPKKELFEYEGAIVPRKDRGTKIEVINGVQAYIEKPEAAEQIVREARLEGIRRGLLEKENKQREADEKRIQIREEKEIKARERKESDTIEKEDLRKRVEERKVEKKEKKIKREELKEEPTAQELIDEVE